MGTWWEHLISQAFDKLHLASHLCLPSTAPLYTFSPMAFKKPRKTGRKVIDRDRSLVGGPSTRTESVIAHNYYEAGPSGVEFTDRILNIEVHDPPRPAKIPRLQSPPRSERPSPPPHTLYIADVDPSHSIQGVISSVACDSTVFPHCLAENSSQSVEGVTSAGTPVVSVAPVSEIPVYDDSRRLLDDQAVENRKKKKARNCQQRVQHFTEKCPHRSSPVKSWTRLARTYRIYSGIFWPERRTPAYLVTVNTVSLRPRCTGVETAPNHPHYVDAVCARLIATHLFTGWKSG